MHLQAFFLGIAGLVIACLPSNGAENDPAASPVFKEFVQQARVQANAPQAGGFFGYHLDLSADGRVMAVGAYGSVYVFTRVGETWTQQARFESSAGASEYFGIAVALSANGDTLAIGAHFAFGPNNAYASGRVYVYTNANGTWALQARVQAGDAVEHGHFGTVTISADGNTLAVGAYAYDLAHARSGKVHIFTRSDGMWTEQSRLQASDAAGTDCFGVSVALAADGNTLAVSAYCAENSGGVGAGNAYMFARAGSVWTEQARLQASDPAAEVRFGTRIAISADGSTMATGAYLARNSGGEAAGNAYVFTRSDGVWTEQSRLQASDAAPDGRFGTSLALNADGSMLAVGAYASTNSGGVNAGNAYVFTRTGDTWTERSRLQASDAAAGDYFGIRVAMCPDGSTLAVGAYGVSNSGLFQAGRVYVFVRKSSP